MKQYNILNILVLFNNIYSDFYFLLQCEVNSEIHY